MTDNSLERSSSGAGGSMRSRPGFLPELPLPDDLEKIAKVGRKYRVPMLKITSGQRLAQVGLEPDTEPLVHR